MTILPGNKIKAVFKATPSPSLILLPDAPLYTIAEVNRAYLRDTNSSESDLIGKGVFEAFPRNPYDPAATGVDNLKASLDQVVATGETHVMATQKYDIPVRGTNEFEERYWNPVNIPVTDENGKVEFIIHNVTDVTRQILSEKKEKESRRELLINRDQYRSLFDQNPFAVYSFDLTGKFVSVNESAASLTEYSREELLRKDFTSIVAPEDVEKVLYHGKRAADGHPQTYDAAIITAGGKRCMLNMTNLPIVVDGKTVGVYGIAMDITERLKIQKAITSSLQEKEVLLTEIHHRVKNNLAIISGLLSMQGSSARNKQLREMLQISESRVRSMGMIHELLYQQEDFSRVSFCLYVEKLLEYLNHYHYKSDKGVEILVDAENIYLEISKAVPCALILNELVTNAFKHAFTGNKSEQLIISMKRLDKTCMLTVEDNGIGMDNNKPQTEETLGLSLINGLVRQLDGSISIQSGRGGTSISIIFNDQPAEPVLSEKISDDTGSNMRSTG